MAELIQYRSVLFIISMDLCYIVFNGGVSLYQTVSRDMKKLNYAYFEHNIHDLCNKSFERELQVIIEQLLQKQSIVSNNIVMNQKNCATIYSSSTSSHIIGPKELITSGCELDYTSTYFCYILSDYV